MVILGLLKGAMKSSRNILKDWLQTKPSQCRSAILKRVSTTLLLPPTDIAVEAIVEQLGAGLVAECAKDLGLTPIELTSLMREPRKDALSGLITMVRDGV